MSGNEYLIEVMTKIDSFNQWLAKYNNFDFGWGERYSLFLAVLALTVILLFLLAQDPQQDKADNDNDNEKEKEKNILIITIITLVLSVILFCSAIAIYTSHQSKITNLNNAAITLEEFKRYQPIDFDKFPEWAKSDLIADGKLYYTKVRKAIEKQKEEKRKNEKLEQIKKRKELMYSMRNNINVITMNEKIFRFY